MFINGSYLHLAGSSGTIAIEDSIFRLGLALYGGAIYSASMTKIKLSIVGSDFKYNKASVSGGAVLLDQMDSYDIKVDKIGFKENLCRYYGDNLYMRQTEMKHGEITPTVEGAQSERRL